MAGVSVDYYVRIEQGRVPRPSAAVLDALARALCLTPDETEHLYALTQPRPVGRSGRGSATAAVRPMLLRLLQELVDVPALVMGRRMDVLAWNEAACALLGDYSTLPPAHRNIAWITFMNPASRTLYADWQDCARENVAFLRMEAGRHPDDARLARLVRELSVQDEDFRRWWAEHPVRDKTAGTKRFRHPIVGDVELVYDTLRAGETRDQALITYAAEPGTPSDDALRLLLSWAAPDRRDRRPKA
jgi:PAS domain-containing protein